jgi:hypothetical protein
MSESDQKPEQARLIMARRILAFLAGLNPDASPELHLAIACQNNGLLTIS